MTCHRSTSRFVCTALLAVATLVTIGQESKPAPRPQKSTAETLIADAEHALASIAKAAKDAKVFDPKNVRQQPFWAAVKQADETLNSVKAQLKSRDPKFFDSLNDATRDAAELRALYPRSGMKNPKIEEGVKAASNALTLLRRNYGRESNRKRKTPELSEDEKADFATLKKVQTTLVEELADLEGELHSNKHLSAELNHLITQLQLSIDEPASIESLQRARELVDIVEGEWEAYSYYVEPKSRKSWNESKAKEAIAQAVEISDDFDGVPEEADWMLLDAQAKAAAAEKPVEKPAEKTPVKIAAKDGEKEQPQQDPQVAEFQKFLQSLNPVELDAFYEALADEFDAEYDELMIDPFMIDEDGLPYPPDPNEPRDPNQVPPDPNEQNQ